MCAAAMYAAAMYAAAMYAAAILVYPDERVACMLRVDAT
jgi:hypothetical protein